MASLKLLMLTATIFMMIIPALSYSSSFDTCKEDGKLCLPHAAYECCSKYCYKEEKWLVGCCMNTARNFTCFDRIPGYYD